MTYEDERAVDVAKAEAHMRQRAVREAIDSAIYEASPEIHAALPKLADVLLAAFTAYDVIKAEAIREAIEKELDGITMAGRGATTMPEDERAFYEGTEWKLEAEQRFGGAAPVNRIVKTVAVTDPNATFSVGSAAGSTVFNRIKGNG